MKITTIIINNKLGLHARAAAKFVTMASRFSANVEISFSERTVNGKSIMGVMMLAAAKGSEIEIRCDGTDEEDAMQALTELIENRFGEEA
jgi:phosphocarrier protein